MTDIEIIVVDNGSTISLRRDDFAADVDITVLRVDDGGASPCIGINRAVDQAKGQLVAVMIDGARMASPGLLAAALGAIRIDPQAFVATLGFHLGPKVQQVSVAEGYTRAVENELLAEIGWPSNGYRLFEVCALGESYRDGALAAPPETTFFVMRRDRFLSMGGFNEGFRQIGGGFANYDFFERAVADTSVPFVMLIGEGTFHQLHYGATTQEGGIGRAAAPDAAETLSEVFAQEYEVATGRPHERSWRSPILHGCLTHPAARRFFFPPTSA